MTNAVKVTEFGEASVVIEVYQKYLPSVNKHFFDVVCAFECVEGVSRFLSPLIRVEHIPRLISGVVDAMGYISYRHKELRSNEGAATVKATHTLPYQYSNTQMQGADGIEFDKMQQYLSHVKEFKVGSVACDLYSEEINGVNAFKVCCWREYADSDGNRKREF